MRASSSSAGAVTTNTAQALLGLFSLSSGSRGAQEMAHFSKPEPALHSFTPRSINGEKSDRNGRNTKDAAGRAAVLVLNLVQEYPFFLIFFFAPSFFWT